MKPLTGADMETLEVMMMDGDKRSAKLTLTLERISRAAGIPLDVILALNIKAYREIASNVEACLLYTSPSPRD